MNIKAFLGFAVTAILFYFLLKDMDLHLFWDYIKKGNLLLILSGATLYLSSFFLRGLRWKILLKHIKTVALSETIKLTAAGYAVNNVLPSRLGEFTRSYLAGKRNGFSRTSALASIFVERVFDGLTIVAILATILFIYPFPGWVKNLSEVGSMIFGGLFMLIVFSSFSTLPIKILEKIEKKSPKFMNPIFSLGEKFLNGAASIASFSRFIEVFLLSFAIWGMEVVVYAAIVNAFQIEIPVIAYFLMLVTVNMGMLIPSTPGGLGIFQFAVVKSLEIFAITSTAGMAVAIVLHMIQIIPVTIIGLSWLYINHISLKNIKQDKQ